MRRHIRRRFTLRIHHSDRVFLQFRSPSAQHSVIDALRRSISSSSRSLISIRRWRRSNRFCSRPCSATVWMYVLRPSGYLELRCRDLEFLSLLVVLPNSWSVLKSMYMPRWSVGDVKWNGSYPTASTAKLRYRLINV
jgi:hypothetical protein